MTNDQLTRLVALLFEPTHYDDEVGVGWAEGVIRSATNCGPIDHFELLQAVGRAGIFGGRVERDDDSVFVWLPLKPRKTSAHEQIEIIGISRALEPQ